MIRIRTLFALAILPLASLAAFVGTSSAADPAARPSALPPMVHPEDNAPTPEKLALGRQLFVDPRLSGTGTMACQGCHYHELGWTVNIRSTHPVKNQQVSDSRKHRFRGQTHKSLIGTLCPTFRTRTATTSHFDKRLSSEAGVAPVSNASGR